MKTLKIGDNVWMITLGGVDSNIYVVDGCLLVDTGTGKQVEGLRQAFEDIGLSFDEITAIVNTHAHFDHIGGNPLFKNAKVLAHEFSAPVIEEGDNIGSYAQWFSGKLEKRNCIKLRDKDIVRAKDTRLDVIHAPGHSEGSICLLDKKTGTLFSGDVVFKQGLGRTDLLGGSDKNLKITLEKLALHDVKTILPGHGEIIEDGATHIKNMLENSR